MPIPGASRRFLLFLVPALFGAFQMQCAPSEDPAQAQRDTPPGSSLHKCGLVLERGPLDAWDAGMIESPVVWYDAARRRYGMVYTGYAWVHPPTEGYDAVATPQVGLAWSDDLRHWEKDPNSPIFGPSGRAGSLDEHGTSGPFLWQEDGRYYLFYFGLTGTGYEKGLKTLNLATSTDLYTWVRYEGNPVIAPAGDGWRSEAIWHPNIVKVDGTYYLFFNASGVVARLHEERIGYATSTDLYHWTVDDAVAPILAGSGTPGRWDASGRAGDPSLYRVGDVWYMAYYSWDRQHAQDGLAMTTSADFPVGWQPYEGNPILQIGTADSFDALHAAKPFILRRPGQHYHFYTAVDSSESREIALAMSPACE
jgi:predicted GH43/DUF377 family glycosyl hydrolase